MTNRRTFEKKKALQCPWPIVENIALVFDKSLNVEYIWGGGSEDFKA